ncbi:MAG TPA: hypothetical protein ENJ23_03090 [Bacteroidetes bacterium]|nr:hypothetical protein [Bacteroidota bacterium]
MEGERLPRPKCEFDKPTDLAQWSSNRLIFPVEQGQKEAREALNPVHFQQRRPFENPHLLLICNFFLDIFSEKG